MSKISKAELVAEYQQLIAGLQKNAPNLALIIASQTYTTSQIITILQSLVTSGSSVITTKSSWHVAVLANNKLEAQYALLVSALRVQLGSMYSDNETTLADFGLSPRKQAKPLTVEEAAAKKAKAAATRLARGTTSKQKKAAITGNVTGVTITPVTSASAPAASASAATPAAPASATAAAGAPAPVSPSSPTASPAAPASPSSASSGVALVQPAIGSSHG
jgi:hypothetical protein